MNKTHNPAVFHIMEAKMSEAPKVWYWYFLSRCLTEIHGKELLLRRMRPFLSDGLTSLTSERRMSWSFQLRPHGHNRISLDLHRIILILHMLRGGSSCIKLGF